jgi:hypothetical protein
MRALLLTISTVLVAANTAHAAKFIPLPTLPSGIFGPYSGEATGVSGDGRVVVGVSNSDAGQQAIRWTRTGYTNHFILVGSQLPARRQTCLLGNMNSFVFDFCARQKIGGVTLNFFIVEQLPTLPPDTYDQPCPWKPKQKLEKWISERVLKLTCTAEDLLPLADACDFTGGSFKTEYQGRLHKWDDADRAQLMAELDAAYFHLYGINRDDAAYILSTFQGLDTATPLLAGPRTKAEHILAEFDKLASA